MSMTTIDNVKVILLDDLKNELNEKSNVEWPECLKWQLIVAKE